MDKSYYPFIPRKYYPVVGTAVGTAIGTAVGATVSAAVCATIILESRVASDTTQIFTFLLLSSTNRDIN